ncbi:MAG: U32 family peptidase, partial [Spirochaetales bacterium]|nr:U32 family peptidase [Spirochaetales bacterium]
MPADFTPESHKCELAIPAGSLQCALYAFKGGADAVYLGMKSFSARKGAVNFSFEDVRKLKAYCVSNGRKFYITLNTIVNDSEMTEVIPMLRQLEYVQPDGVIVQDLGIAKTIREHFPSLPLHGSTQLAVHTINGVKELQSLGFSRVVLSRELSFEEIKEIREACPDVELKIFIHGALCYGFSGLCMASQCITGRSANRGACAQICRTWFSCKETGTDNWLFSMKDLCLGDLVKRYVEIGIDSMKVEGRMKGPDYAYWTARYYSLLLEGRTENDQEVRWAKEAMQVSFSRETTTGFFPTGKAGSTGSQIMVSSSDPGHRGIQVGTIERVLANKAIVRFSKPVAIRDGLKVVSGNRSASFSLSHIDGNKSFISEGETATI